MKFRTDFVTNSSSSSFILTFKDKEELNKFENYCDELNYEDFYNLVKDSIRKPTQEEKERIAEQLKKYYEYEVCNKRDMIEEYIKRENYPGWMEWNSACEDFEKSETFQKEIHKALEKTDYFKKKKKLHKAEYIIDEMIWDYDGGMLEWAIRNGFIESEMRPYCLYVWNVG